jgi:hypothetical protein
MQLKHFLRERFELQLRKGVAHVLTLDQVRKRSKPNETILALLLSSQKVWVHA